MKISTKVFRAFMSIATAMLFVINGTAQSPRLLGGDFDTRGNNRMKSGLQTNSNDSINEKSIPKGLTVWTIDERFGVIQQAVPDTLSYLFQNSNYTEGKYGEYNFTGNLGSPRITRIYQGEQDYMMGSQFVFVKPYDWFLKGTQNFVFTNTKSPIAQLYYHAAGNKQEGDDRFRAQFATNINKQTGIGFNIDYAYGMGFYRNQNHSSLGGSIYGSYVDDQYKLHAFYNTNHLKNVENGGLEDDSYITNPESFPTSYRSRDIPVRLEGVKNTINVNRFFLSHNYSLGYYQYVDSVGRIVKKMQSLSSQKEVITDTTNQTDAKVLPSPPSVTRDSTLHRQFVAVAALIHTLNIEDNFRKFTSKGKTDKYFKDAFYSDDFANDLTQYFSMQNTFALEMQEGFKKWVKTGMRIFAKHEYTRFNLPDTQRRQESTTYNYVTIGGQLMRNKSALFRYDILGETRTTGTDWGEFNLRGNVRLRLPILRDTIEVTAGGFVRNEPPAYYYRHYHGQHAWWDKNLDNIFRVRMEGELSYHRSAFQLGIESIQNYAYFQELQQQHTSENNQQFLRYGVTVEQTKKNIQLFSATFRQNWKWGILNWEGRFTLQKSSEESTLPLPLLTLWNNLYLKFNIAKVLHTELGTDIRYFTKYYAPSYSPIIGQFAVQGSTQRTYVGNYPWVNTYVNFTLKGVRFYLTYAHVNSAKGRSFLVPHYPTNDLVLRFGISWNFYN